MKIYDVIVIGAGPAGSFFTREAVNNGLDVLILEARANVTRKVCGEYLCPQGVELLRNSGLDEIIDKFKPLSGMKIFTPKGRLVDTTFPETESFKEKGLAVNRQVFDSYLIDEAQNCGGTILFSKRVKTFDFNGSMWSVKTDDGQVQYCRLLVGADGRGSFVAKKLGLTKQPSSTKVAIHTWITTKHQTGQKGEMHIFSDGSYIGLDPTDDNELNVSLVCDSDIVKLFGSKHRVLNHYIKESPYLHNMIGDVDDDTKVQSNFPLVHSTKRSINHNVALIGDAAGFIDPITGEGIYNALKTAKLLSQSIKRFPSYISYKDALKEYEKERTFIFKQKSTLNRFFQKLLLFPAAIEIIAWYLNKKQNRKDSFIGIIGNIFSPLEGLMKIIL